MDQVYGVVLFALVWAVLLSMGVLLYKVVRALEAGVKDGRFTQGL